MELSNYTDIFNKEFTGELPFNHPGNHAIKTDGKDLLYKPLYNLFTRKLEVLHQYLNEILEKRWIKSFINLARVFILFMLKKDKNLRLYINYQGLNKVIIKNQYLLPFIGEILDWLYNIKIFSKLNLKDIYHYIRIKIKDE